MRRRFPVLYSVLNKTRRDLHLLVLRATQGADDPEKIFSYYFERNLFGDPESLSGTGSSAAATRTIRAALPGLFASLNTRVILDIPCGDFNWAKELDWTPFKYIGADIVSALVERNRRRFASEEVEFLVLDILQDTLPRSDLILCRDLFVHFPNHLVMAALRKIGRSGASYLLCTQYDRVRRNRDIRLGSFRPLDLTRPPFGLPPPERTIPDDDYLKLWGRSLALWPIDDRFLAVASDSPGPGMDK